MEKPPPVTYDISDWAALDSYLGSHEAGTFLLQKGFCLIKGNLSQKLKLGAEREARHFRKTERLTRVPYEACNTLFGASVSCWTKELSNPKGEVPEEEVSLHAIDQQLEHIGMWIANSSQLYFKANLIGRTNGMLHHSRLPEDGDPPSLTGVDEAGTYSTHAVKKKVQLMYYLGPSAATLTIIPWEDTKRQYSVAIKKDVIIAFRNDICRAFIDTRGYALSVHVDFLIETRLGIQDYAKDDLPIPKELAEWYDAQLLKIAEGHDDDNYPMTYVKEARMNHFKKEPCRIVQIERDLPTLAFFGGGTAPFEASVLGGQDVVTEIIKPPSKKGLIGMQGSVDEGPAKFSAKWDLDEYYDDDPKNAANFKMYTRHLAVLNRGHDPRDDYDIATFNITSMENFSLDPRAKMLAESHMKCLKNTNFNSGDTQNQAIGFFMGISGEDQYWQIMTNKTKINKYSWTNSSTSAMVTRMSYIMNAKGPAVSIDTDDSSGLVALDTAVGHLRENRCEPFAFASACEYIANPLKIIFLCAAGLIAQSGRTRAFDASADGFTKGEGVITTLIELHSAPERREKLKPTPMQPGEKQYEPIGIRALIIGTGVNSRGQSTSLSAPNMFSFFDVFSRTARDAGFNPSLLDSWEASATGSVLHDTMELFTMRGSLNHNESRTASVVPIHTHRSTYGHLGPVSGLVSIARACLLLEKCLHGPTPHLRQFLEDDSITQGLGGESYHCRDSFLTEIIEGHTATQMSGVSSFGATGTSVFMYLKGKKIETKQERKVRSPITWWPGGAQKASNPPLRGYYIVGTWTNWQYGFKMVEESEGVYGYTLAMGDNRWEMFQIWLDEDADQVLHPKVVRASRECEVIGPTSGVRTAWSWQISAKSETVRLVNEVQAKRWKELNDMAKARGEEIPPPEYRIDCAYAGDYRPPGYENASGESEMPLVDVNSRMTGSPGDKYRIRLHVRGKYKRVEWVKDDNAVVGAEPQLFTHKYHIIGDHNYWTFEQMTLDKVESGLYTAWVKLLKTRTHFQIFRNEDWDQGLYPESAEGDMYAKILGPDVLGGLKRWCIEGQVGDIFRVDFRRNIVGGEDQRTIKWDHEGNTPVDFEELAKSHRFFLAGSWTEFKKTVELKRDDNGNYCTEIIIGLSGTETFQILLHNNWLAAIHPSFNDATMYDDGHTLEGPDDGGAGLYWAIGMHPRDTVSTRSHALVHLDMEGGLPKRVWWEKIESQDSHHEYLAWGCQRIFERHCKLMGFTPYEHTTRAKAKMNNKPEFMYKD